MGFGCLGLRLRGAATRMRAACLVRAAAWGSGGGASLRTSGCVVGVRGRHYYCWVRRSRWVEVGEREGRRGTRCEMWGMVGSGVVLVVVVGGVVGSSHQAEGKTCLLFSLFIL